MIRGTERIRTLARIASFDFVSGDRAVAPSIAEPPHVVLRKAPAAAGQQDEAEEGRRFPGGFDAGLLRVKP